MLCGRLASLSTLVMLRNVSGVACRTRPVMSRSGSATPGPPTSGPTDASPFGSPKVTQPGMGAPGAVFAVDDADGEGDGEGDADGVGDAAGLVLAGASAADPQGLPTTGVSFVGASS